jgi:hypothetical protein
MNNIFNLNRFSGLFVKHTVEHYKSYLMSLTVLIGVMLLGGSFLVYMMQEPIDKNFQTVLFVMLLLMAGTVFTSTIFADFGDKKKAIAALTLPASHFEKYLVAWLYSFVLFLILYTVGFYLVVLFAVNIRHFPGQQAEMLNVFDRRVVEMYLLYAFLHSIAFGGAIFFEKLHFVKTAFLFFIFIAVLIILNKVILSMLLGIAVEATVPFGNLRFAENNMVVDINITRQHETYTLLITVVLTLIFWVAAYFCLKEKQV